MVNEMRIFEKGMEIGLTREDVAILLNDAIDRKFIYSYKVSAMTLHPKNKYIVRLTVVNPSKKSD